jgi:aryl-alcohol dehydrogenase-like predicted oxidoreductase
LRGLAEEKGIAPAQLAIAWVLARNDFVVPVIGARTRVQLAQSLAALDVRLSSEEVDRVERLVNARDIAGTRYDPRQMRMLDSER